MVCVCAGEWDVSAGEGADVWVLWAAQSGHGGQHRWAVGGAGEKQSAEYGASGSQSNPGRHQ